MTETQIHKALWKPGWYEMDQGLLLGHHQRYWFFQEIPDELRKLEPQVEFVFFNQLASGKASEVRYAKIIDMVHQQLGSLIRIDTDGLDYIFESISGEEIVVNAEEEPGTTDDPELQIEDWSVIVTLAEVSEPVADVA